MVKVRLEGKCVLCGEVYTKRGMTRHLRACIERTVGEKGFSSDKENGKSLIVTAECAKSALRSIHVVKRCFFRW